jgi:hypothetical protein
MRSARIGSLILSGIMFFGLFFAATVHAQMSPQEAAQIGSQDISFTSDPEVPGAFTDTTITVDSYSTDVSRAFFIWKKDGKTVLSATGSNRYTFTTKDIGQKTTIGITMLLVTGETIQKDISFNPSEINLVWEGADAYVPPFYKGRALPASEGAVRVLAIPQISNASGIIDTTNYVFRWKKNDAILSADSGYGKSSLVFQQDYLNPNEKIEVTGQNNATGEIAKGLANVGVYTAKILMYVRDPIYGIDWNHEIGNSFDVSTSEKTIIAIPYFFSPFNPTSQDLTYKWTVNGDSVDTPSIPNVFTLKSGDSKGISSLGLGITNKIKLFLDAQRDVTVNLK